ncbi:hypothetical protein LMG28140_00370 [Paraburkholderia metrosideri]|jgi:hypothetical protein|uniref:Uncharacterized protein n=1 Tax=Paraburkholderia metrosideri TaxID=580937 RepID=A0ABM8N9W6_9BURK|nr:hypothetical protein LMG28140_00370 [Paraburkholderia metrosideri]
MTVAVYRQLEALSAVSWSGCGLLGLRARSLGMLAMRHT